MTKAELTVRIEDLERDIAELRKSNANYLRREYLSRYQIKRLQGIISGFWLLADKYNIPEQEVSDAMWIRRWMPHMSEKYKQDVLDMLKMYDGIEE